MNSDITLILNGLIYGFCYTTFISYLLSVFKSKKLKRFNKNFFQYAIKTIRIIAIIYFFYYAVYLVNFHLIKEHTLFSERATVPYWFAYWLMLLRPLVFCLLLQLLWVFRFQKKSTANFILVLIVFFSVLFSGINIERYIIIVTSYHRDYALESNYLNNFNWFQIILIGFFQRLLFFSTLVFVVHFTHKKLINRFL